MIRFARSFPDAEIVATLSQQLSWSHFKDLLPVPTDQARQFYIDQAVTARLSVRALRELIGRKVSNAGPPGIPSGGRQRLGLRCPAEADDRYERRDGEEAPIGLILCTEASREQIELLEMHKDGSTARPLSPAGDDA